jgi:hypothetical protein
VAVQIYSDNSDEVTGATLNSGEIGGTWTKAGKLLDVTVGPDGRVAVIRVPDWQAGHDPSARLQPGSPPKLPPNSMVPGEMVLDGLV